MRLASIAVLSVSIWFTAYAQGADVRDLIAKLKNKDSDVRRSAAKELGELKTEAKSAVPELIRATRDKDLFVRRYAAEALGNIGPDAKSGITALSAVTNDEKKEVAEAAVDALGRIGPDAIPALTSVLKDPNKHSNVRRKAAVALGKLGLRAHGSVPAMADVLSGKVKMAKKGKGVNDDDIRVEVATALGSVAKADDAAAIEALKAVSEGKQKNKALKKAAGDALRQIDRGEK